MKLEYTDEQSLFFGSLQRFVDTIGQLLQHRDPSALPTALSGFEELGFAGLNELGADARMLAIDAIRVSASGAGFVGLAALSKIIGSALAWRGAERVLWVSTEDRPQQAWCWSDQSMLDLKDISPFEPMGFRELYWGQSRLDDADEQPSSWAVGDPRVLFGALAVGMGEGATKRAIDYANERTQFGKPIGQFQAIQHRLADSVTELRGALTMLYAATGLRQCISALVRSLDAAMVSIDHSVQIFGGYGYTEEFEVERFYRDICTLRSLLRVETLRLRLGAEVVNAAG